MISVHQVSEPGPGQVELTFTNVLPLTDGNEEYDITGLRITYVNAQATAIRLITSAGPLFAHAPELATPDTWPVWLRSLVEQHRPAHV
ncbi:hypothetical protein [Streptomyces sp. NPDC051173]|uniref:hypothetical protein n=1 Tax=Streptomyces sp. NPDC051173 TaxID=3155164 RepID=UPI00344ED0AA